MQSRSVAIGFEAISEALGAEEFDCNAQPMCGGEFAEGSSSRWMLPGHIKFTQSSISRVFCRRKGSRPTYSEALKVTESDAGAQSLENLLQQLRKGEVLVTEIPPIRVYFHEGVPYSLDNRRLWVFKHFGERIPVELVEDCAKEFFQKWNPETSGDLASVSLLSPGAQGKDKFYEISMVHQVLSWSLDNIVEERLYVNKAEPLQVSFSSRNQYLKAFRWPLLEETRAAIHHKLQSVDLAPRLQVRLQECQTPADQPKFKSFQVQVSVGGNYKPRTRDLFLFSTIAPKYLEELNRSGTHYTLGFISKVLDFRGSEDNISMTAILYVPDRSQEYYAVQDVGRTWHAIYITNLATKLRIWEALEYLHSRDVEGAVLQEILDPQFRTQVPKSKRSSLPEIQQRVKKYCKDVRALNGSQIEAVTQTVSGLVSKEWPLIRLIQGPPGTGKTLLLSSLLCILGGMNYRIHMCAPTNTAICEVASRFVAQMLLDTMSEKGNVQFGAFCPGLVTNHEKLNKILHLGDVVLLGNEEKLNFSGDKLLESIYLPCRVGRLMEALSPITGYRSSFQALMQLLRFALADYNLYKQCSQLDGSTKKPESLYMYVSKKLKNLGSAMVKNCDIMCQDLPSHILEFGTRVRVHNASNHVKQMLECLTSNEIPDEQIRFLFSTGADGHSLNNFQEGCSDVVMSKFQHVLEAKSRLLEILEAYPGFDVFGGKVPHEAELERTCLRHTVVLFSTVGTGGRNCVAKSGSFDCVVIDEASQLVEAETLVVLQSSKLQQLILVGDHKQLPATVISKVATHWDYGRSLFKRLHMLDHPCQLLDTQYRMHPDISAFPNNQFYNGHVKDGPNVLAEDYSNKPFQCTRLQVYSFLDIKDGSEQRDIGGTSWMNLVEARIVMHMISVLNKVCAENDIFLTVGVIAPYSGQVQVIAKHIDAIAEKLRNVMAEVQSVDGLQGREKDVIIFSAVRSNASGDIGFLSAHERLNVAITRARHCLWILGNASTLCRDSVWRSLIENTKQRKCFIQPDNDILKVIKKVKIEMNELAELLKPTSGVFNHTIWKVSFSNELKKTVQTLKSKVARQLILSAMLRLAQGKHATKRKYERTPNGPYSMIAQVHYVADLCLVWSVDVEFAPAVKQVLKFWDVVESARIPSLLRRLEAGFATYTDAYVDRCLSRQVTRGTVVTPKMWELEDDFVRYKALEPDALQSSSTSQEEAVLEKCCVDESTLQMKFFALNSGIAHQLITAADGSSLDLPFVVNDDEARIIDYPGSSFIIGRSGTGKTTVLTTKLLQRQQHFSLAEHGFLDIQKDDGEESKRANKEQRTLKQALVTRSPKLCAAIKNHINKIQRALEAAASGATLISTVETEDEMKLYEDEEEKLLGSIPNSFQDIPAESYPLVITFSKMLNMIEGCLVNKFFTPDERAWRERMCELELGNSSLLDAEQLQESSLKADRPEPKALNEWCILPKIGHSSVEKDKLETEVQGGCARLLPRKVKPRLEVDYIRFCSVYWKHFNKDVTRKLDESLLYSEIMSCIKGSLLALRSSKRCLERVDYVSLASTKTSTLNEGLREDIYSLYLQYEKMKRMWNDYDLADYIIHLHRELENGAYKIPYLDYVYIDEVQDLTPTQIALFKYLCPNVQDGFMFAGDTAQTIAKGVGFRFEDIRNLFYVEFLGKSIPGVQDATRAQNSTQQKEVGGRSKYESAIPVPDLHYLARNYRTHMGILKVANSVVQLIYDFFPYAIDRLKPETSVLHGEAPLFLEIEENHDLVTALFNRGEMGGGGCEFGAEQAILVRDERRKHAMLRSLEAMKKSCLVLTVEECKGLEFQDVLLYNFFADSRLGRKWRVLYSSLQDGDFLSAEEKLHLAASIFEFRKHSALCAELKQLYVAVTRARQRLWIYDNDLDSHKPILDYWRAAKLVQVQFLDDSLAEDLIRKSSPEDWKRRGIKLFRERQYLNAKLCFEKAGDLANAKLAEAEDCLQAANRPGFDAQKAASHRQTALDIFLDVNNIDRALMCCKILQDHKQAGAILENTLKFEEAGDCYSEGKHFVEAATAYHKGACFEKCLAICWQSKFFDVGLAYISKWEHVVDQENTQETVDSIKVAYLQRCADYYKNQGKTQEMMKYVRLFPNMDLKRVMLKDNHLEELLEVEEAAGNFVEAERIAEEIGLWEHSATLSAKSGDAQRAVDKLLHIAQLQIFWGNGTGQELIRKAEAIANSQPETNSVSKLEMDILKTFESGNRGEWMTKWKEVRSLEALRLEILIGKYVICDILSNVLVRPGCFTSKVLQQWDVPMLYSYEAALEGMQILVVCKKLWVIWSKCINSILEGLESFNCRENIRASDIYPLQCCFHFLGVRQRASGGFYLEYPKASWLKGQRLDRKGEISKRDLTILALQYWKDEILQVTKKISIEMEKVFQHILGDAKTDVEVHFEICIEMMEIFQLLEKMNFHNIQLSGLIYWDWSASLENILQNYTGLVYGSPRKGIVAPILDAVAIKAWQERKLGSCLALYPFISRQCIDQMMTSPSRPGLPYAMLQSWRFCNDESLCLEPPLPCETMVSFVTMYFDEHGYLAERGSSFCFWAERVAVSLCSVYTHLRGLVIPVKLAYSCMSGPNQENFYSQAAKVACSSHHQSMADLFGQVIDEIIDAIRLQCGRKFTIRLIVVLLVLLINFNDATTRGRKLVAVQQVFMARYRMWDLPGSFQIELVSAFRRQQVNIAQVGQALARAMVAQADPLIVLRAQGPARDLPAWVERELITVFMENGSSGRPIFRGKGTVLDLPPPHIGILPPVLLGNLERGDLRGMAEIFSREPPVQSNSLEAAGAVDEESTSDAATNNDDAEVALESPPKQMSIRSKTKKKCSKGKKKKSR